MTGFAADVQHLTRVTLSQVESHQMIYSHAMSVDRIVLKLSSFVQRAARVKGGRPYGVQALIVGLDAEGKFQLYTVDPAGGWQHYGGGATAVGQGAEDVRAQLYKAMQNATLTNSDSGPNEALTRAVFSLVGKSVRDSGDVDYSNKLEALLVWKSEIGSCCVSRIDDSEIQSCLKRIVDKE